MSSSLTPSEAGQKAYAMRQELELEQGGTKPISLDTMLAHAGIKPNLETLNTSLSPPLEMATTFERPPSGTYPEGGSVYSRIDNPTRRLLESEVYRLETNGMPTKGKDPGTTTAYSSGMAAVSAILLALPKSHVLIPDDCYHGVSSQLAEILSHHGIAHTPIDMTDLEVISHHVDKVSPEGSIAIWMETPSNPCLKVTDMESVCVWAKQSQSDSGKRLVTVVDSTWAPPLITQPLLLGADIVMHSATKYFGGHSDLTLGLVTTSPASAKGVEIGQALRNIQACIGAVASPFESWLCLRGMRSLRVRLERQCETAMELALFLSQHPSVAKVHYPGLIDHPQHVVAKRQMQKGWYGGMLSFEMRDEAAAFAVAGALNLITRATSLGGTETLIEHRASIEPPDRITSPPGLLRVSVGLEDCQDLKDDLSKALEIADNICGQA